MSDASESDCSEVSVFDKFKDMICDDTSTGPYPDTLVTIPLAYLYKIINDNTCICTKCRTRLENLPQLCSYGPEPCPLCYSELSSCVDDYDSTEEANPNPTYITTVNERCAAEIPDSTLICDENPTTHSDSNVSSTEDTQSHFNIGDISLDKLQKNYINKSIQNLSTSDTDETSRCYNTIEPESISTNVIENVVDPQTPYVSSCNANHLEQTLTDNCVPENQLPNGVEYCNSTQSRSVRVTEWIQTGPDHYQPIINVQNQVPSCSTRVVQHSPDYIFHQPETSNMVTVERRRLNAEGIRPEYAKYIKNYLNISRQELRSAATIPTETSIHDMDAIRTLENLNNTSSPQLQTDSSSTVYEMDTEAPAPSLASNRKINDDLASFLPSLLELVAGETDRISQSYSNVQNNCTPKSVETSNNTSNDFHSEMGIDHQPTTRSIPSQVPPLEGDAEDDQDSNSFYKEESGNPDA